MKMDFDKWGLAALAVVLAVLPFTASGYVLYIVNLLMIYIVLALGLHIVIGETGQFALSHAAFYGIGIYAAGIINNAWHLNFAVSVLAAGVITAALGYLLGALAIRMRDIYLALSTFAFGEAMQWVFLNWTEVTNGSNGYQMSRARFFGFELTSDLRAYPFVVLGAALMLWLTVRLSRSQPGAAFRAVRESDVAAQAMGIDANVVKRVAFMCSAAYAGVAGGLYTTFASFIHPESLGFWTTILILIMIVVGGIGSVRGAVIGALIFGLISELLRQVLSFQEIIYGLILIGFMMFAPRGCSAAVPARARRRRPSPMGEPAHEPSDDAVDQGPDGALRRPDRRGRPVLRGRPGADPRPDRAQRGRQVHHLQLHFPLLRSHGGSIALAGSDITRRGASEMAALGVGAHVPEPGALQRVTAEESVLLGTYA